MSDIPPEEFEKTDIEWPEPGGEEPESATHSDSTPDEEIGYEGER